VTEDRRQRVQGLIEKIRDVLISDWDPIGVGDNPNLREEYDSTLSPLLAALSKGAGEEELASILAAAETRFGIVSDDARRERTVTKLMAARESIGLTEG
jgi:hypothetical protein